MTLKHLEQIAAYRDWSIAQVLRELVKAEYFDMLCKKSDFPLGYKK